MTTSTDLISLDEVQDTLINGTDLDVVSPDAVQDDMVRRILGAETVEDAFGNFKSINAKDLEGIKVGVYGVAWMRSAFKEGPKVYALLDATIVDTEEKVTVSMGGRSLMASFLWAQRNRAMPIVGTFRAERSNSDPEKSFWTFLLAGPGE